MLAVEWHSEPMQTTTTTSPYMEALIETAIENGGRVTVTEKEASSLVATGRFVRVSGSERARGGFLVTSCTVVTVALALVNRKDEA